MKWRGISTITILFIIAMLIGAIIFQVIVTNQTETEKKKTKPENEGVAWENNGLSEENLKNVALASTLFGLELMQNLSAEQKNILFSPLSIWLAMAMLYEGAGGETAKEMAKVLQFPDEKSILRDNVKWFLENFANHTGNYTLKIANSLWIQEGFPVKKNYTETLKEYYYAHTQLLNFLKNPEEARRIINSWIENETNGKIRNFFPPGSINPETISVLVNAMYFHGSWAHPFNASKTDKEYFYTPQGKISVNMMHISRNFKYTEDKDAQVLKMPYSGNNLSMLIVLPKKEKLNISIENIKKWRDTLTSTKVNVTFPKFKLDEKFSLKKVLESMGIKSVFTPEANLSYISPESGIFASDVLHETYISVDEKGTEAAAATGIPIAGTISIPQEPVEFKVDHPFLFIIQDDETGAIFFMGWVENPQG